MPRSIRTGRECPTTGRATQADEIEAVLERQMEKLTRKFLNIAHIENKRFVTEHAGVAVTAGAATGGCALIGASLHIFASMICRLTPEYREIYVNNLGSYFESALRSHIEEAIDKLKKH